MKHLPSPDNLGNDGYFISNSNGDILQAGSRQLIFSDTKQARAVKAYARLTLLMKRCNDCKSNDNFVYKIHCVNGCVTELLVDKCMINKLDIYFNKKEDAQKVISDPNWFRILQIYFRGEVNN